MSDQKTDDDPIFGETEQRVPDFRFSPSFFQEILPESIDRFPAMTEKLATGLASVYGKFTQLADEPVFMKPNSEKINYFFKQHDIPRAVIASPLFQRILMRETNIILIGEYERFDQGKNSGKWTATVDECKEAYGFACAQKISSLINGLNDADTKSLRLIRRKQRGIQFSDFTELIHGINDPSEIISHIIYFAHSTPINEFEKFFTDATDEQLGNISFAFQGCFSEDTSRESNKSICKKLLHDLSIPIRLAQQTLQPGIDIGN